MPLTLLTSGYDYNLLAQINRCRAALGLTEVGTGASLNLFDQINHLRAVLGLPYIGKGASSDLIKGINDLITPINEFGGGGGSVPAWVQAFRDLVTDPDDFLFGYNFTTGGTGEGWNNQTEELLVVGEVWENSFFGGPDWDAANIIDGLGLQPSTTSTATSLVGLLPASVESNGATLLIEAKAYVSVTNSTNARPSLHLADNPGDNAEGGADVRWTFSADSNSFSLSNSDGAGSSFTITPKTTAMRCACNYTIDSSDLSGSVNGMANETVSGATASVGPNVLAIFHENGNVSDIPVYLTQVAVFSLQAAGSLPTLSAL